MNFVKNSFLTKNNKMLNPYKSYNNIFLCHVIYERRLLCKAEQLEMFVQQMLSPTVEGFDNNLVYLLIKTRSCHNIAVCKALQADRHLISGLFRKSNHQDFCRILALFNQVQRPQRHNRCFARTARWCCDEKL